MNDTHERNIEIRAYHAAGWTLSDIGAKFGLNPGHIGRIIKHKTAADDDPQEASKMLALQDKANYARNRLREGLRNEDLIRVVADIAATAIKPFRPVAPPKFTKRKGAVQETLVLVLSDGHHDQVVRPEEVGGIENYNFPISLRRGQTLVDSTIKFATQTLAGYQFRKLVVLSLGDSTSGSIHDAEKRSAFGNQFKNDIAIGTFHGAMLRDLAAHFSLVEVHCVSGNHGRVTTSKEYAGGPHRNHDYAIAKIAQSICFGQGNVRFNIPDSWSTTINIEGYGFNISHGDDLPGGAPWSSLSKRIKRQAGIQRGQDSSKPFCNGLETDYAVVGHYHTLGFTEGNGYSTIHNGAWLATDQYAYNKLGVAGVPSQWLFGVHQNHGVTWRLPVQLAANDNLAKCRYDWITSSIEGASDSLSSPRLTE